MRLHDHATNQPRTVANNFQIALLDTVPGVSSFAFTIFNDIFDNCRFIIDNTLSIMKLAGQTIYTHIYIYITRSFDPSNFRDRSSTRILESKGFIPIVPSLVKKNNYQSIQRAIHSNDLLLFPTKYSITHLYTLSKPRPFKN